MAGVSVLITVAPILAFSSIASGQVTLDLTSLGTGVDGVIVYYKSSTGNVWTANVQRTATGTFTITGLTDGYTYDFVAVPYDASGNIGNMSNVVHVSMSAGYSVFGVEELLTLLQTALQAVTWRGSATLVFNEEVFIVPEPALITQNELSKMRMPAALIYDLGGQSNVADEDPSFILTRLGLTILTRGDGDPLGTKALMGGNRDSETSSPGAGLFDVHRMVLDQVDLFLRGGTYPARFLGKLTGAPNALAVGDTKHVAQKNYSYLFQLKEA